MTQYALRWCHNSRDCLERYDTKWRFQINHRKLRNLLNGSKTEHFPCWFHNNFWNYEFTHPLPYPYPYIERALSRTLARRRSREPKIALTLLKLVYTNCVIVSCLFVCDVCHVQMWLRSYTKATVPVEFRVTGRNVDNIWFICTNHAHFCKRRCM